LKKVKTEGKPLLAQSLEVAENLLISVENHIKNINPNTELGKNTLKTIEKNLKTIEEAIDAELKKNCLKFA